MHSITMHVFLALSAVSAALTVPRFSVPLEHLEVMAMRTTAPLRMDAVLDVGCGDPNAHIVFHDSNKAQLSICGGISGPGGSRGCAPTSPATTSGEAGTARFEIAPVEPDAVVTISKARWERCVRAARAVCPTGSMWGECVGGASRGNVKFTLARPGELDRLLDIKREREDKEREVDEAAATGEKAAEALAAASPATDLRRRRLARLRR